MGIGNAASRAALASLLLLPEWLGCSGSTTADSADAADAVPFDDPCRALTSPFECCSSSSPVPGVGSMCTWIRDERYGEFCALIGDVRCGVSRSCTPEQPCEPLPVCHSGCEKMTVDYGIVQGPDGSAVVCNHPAAFHMNPPYLVGVCMDE